MQYRWPQLTGTLTEDEARFIAYVTMRGLEEARPAFDHSSTPHLRGALIGFDRISVFRTIYAFQEYWEEIQDGLRQARLDNDALFCECLKGQQDQIAFVLDRLAVMRVKSQGLEIKLNPRAVLYVSQYETMKQIGL